MSACSKHPEWVPQRDPVVVVRIIIPVVVRAVEQESSIVTMAVSAAASPAKVYQPGKR